jgi:hypothetical protein
MGQVITLPKERKRSKFELTTERRHALVTGLCALVFLLGFFIAGPALAIYAFGYVTTSHLGSAAMCVGGLLVTWAVTRAAYKHI